MPIELEKLMSGSKEYDIDHIYPQAYVKDDSIINNKVLVLSKINGGKGKCLVAQSVMQFSSALFFTIKAPSLSNVISYLYNIIPSYSSYEYIN